MKKIISLFQRNYDGDHLVRDEVVPGAEWVLAGEGVATRKWDGTCCLIRDGKLYKRFDAKAGKPLPFGFEPAQEIPDGVTGHWPGWIPVGEGPDDKWHREAFGSGMPCPDNLPGCEVLHRYPDGTYELIGPKIQGNPERLEKHVLMPHATESSRLPHGPPRTFDGIKACLAAEDIEGIVWHHQDGRMAKIKAKDFGIKRNAA